MTDECDVPALDDFWKDGIPGEFVWKTGLNSALVIGGPDKPVGAMQQISCMYAEDTNEYEGKIYRMVLCCSDFPDTFTVILKENGREVAVAQRQRRRA